MTQSGLSLVSLASSKTQSSTADARERDQRAGKHPTHRRIPRHCRSRPVESNTPRHARKSTVGRSRQHSSHSGGSHRVAFRLSWSAPRARVGIPTPPDQVGAWSARHSEGPIEKRRRDLGDRPVRVLSGYLHFRSWPTAVFDGFSRSRWGNQRGGRTSWSTKMSLSHWAYWVLSHSSTVRWRSDTSMLPMAHMVSALHS